MHYKDLSESRLFDKFLVLISNWMILEKMDEKCNLSSQWDRGCTLTPRLMEYLWANMSVLSDYNR